MTDYMRKAVELAYGWGFTDDGYIHDHHGMVSMQQRDKDALAAQLVRQVDATEHYCFDSNCDGAALVSQTWDDPNPEHWKDIAFFDVVDDRTMNTIKAIVDSGVLE